MLFIIVFIWPGSDWTPVRSLWITLLFFFCLPQPVVYLKQKCKCDKVKNFTKKSLSVKNVCYDEHGRGPIGPHTVLIGLIMDYFFKFEKVASWNILILCNAKWSEAQKINYINYDIIGVVPRIVSLKKIPNISRLRKVALELKSDYFFSNLQNKIFFLLEMKADYFFLCFLKTFFFTKTMPPT